MVFNMEWETRSLIVLVVSNLLTNLMLRLTFYQTNLMFRKMGKCCSTNDDDENDATSCYHQHRLSHQEHTNQQSFEAALRSNSRNYAHSGAHRTKRIYVKKRSIHSSNN